MVVFSGQTGGIGGVGWGKCMSASDSGAVFNFDKYGTVVFGSDGSGSNPNVAIQLQKEYGRYFCSTKVCGGFKNWISGKGTIIDIPDPDIIDPDIIDPVIDDNKNLWRNITLGLIVVAGVLLLTPLLKK